MKAGSNSFQPHLKTPKENEEETQEATSLAAAMEISVDFLGGQHVFAYS